MNLINMISLAQKSPWDDVHITMNEEGLYNMQSAVKAVFMSVSENVGFDILAIPPLIFTPLVAVLTASLLLVSMVNKDEQITGQCIAWIKRGWIAWLVLAIVPDLFMIMYGFACAVSGW